MIGNGNYSEAGFLKNPANDAVAISATLAAFGFHIVGGQHDGIDLDYGKFAARIRDFGRQLKEASVALELVELQAILNQMERPRRTSIVILDACRNNPLARNLARAMGLDGPRAAGITEGLANQKVVAGTLIAFGTQPGHVAYDGAGQNGYFTEALLEQLQHDPGEHAHGCKCFGIPVRSLCSSLTFTGDLPAIPRPRESMRRGNHSLDPLARPMESA